MYPRFKIDCKSDKSFDLGMACCGVLLHVISRKAANAVQKRYFVANMTRQDTHFGPKLRGIFLIEGTCPVKRAFYAEETIPMLKKFCKKNIPCLIVSVTITCAAYEC